MDEKMQQGKELYEYTMPLEFIHHVPKLMERCYVVKSIRDEPGFSHLCQQEISYVIYGFLQSMRFNFNKSKILATRLRVINRQPLPSPVCHLCCVVNSTTHFIYLSLSLSDFSSTRCGVQRSGNCAEGSLSLLVVPYLRTATCQHQDIKYTK